MFESFDVSSFYIVLRDGMNFLPCNEWKIVGFGILFVTQNTTGSAM